MADTDIMLDDDGDIVIDAGGEIVTVEGMDVLVQDLRHRLMTVKGSLPADDTYGGDLPLYLHMETHPVRVRAMKTALLEELAKEERILPQLTVLEIREIDRDAVALSVQFVRKADLVSGSLEVSV